MPNFDFQAWSDPEVISSANAFTFCIRSCYGQDFEYHHSKIEICIFFVHCRCAMLLFMHSKHNKLHPPSWVGPHASLQTLPGFPVEKAGLQQREMHWWMRYWSKLWTPFWPDRIDAWMTVLSLDMCSDLPVIFVISKTKRVGEKTRSTSTSFLNMHPHLEPSERVAKLMACMPIPLACPPVKEAQSYTT